MPGEGSCRAGHILIRTESVSLETLISLGLPMTWSAARNPARSSISSHSDVDDRMNVSLPLLYRALRPGAVMAGELFEVSA